MSRSPDSKHANTPLGALINEVDDVGASYPGRAASGQMEAVRRLIDSLEAFRTSSDRWSRRLLWLTAVLVGFTFVLIVVAIESAYLAWVLLERTAR